MSGRKLASATLNYGMAAYLPRLINFVLLPFYAKVLSPEELGVLEVMAGLDAFVHVVTRMGLPGAMARSYFDDKSERAMSDQLVTTGLTITAASAFWTALIFLIGPFIFAHWMADVPFYPYVALTLPATAIRMMPELQARLLQARQMAMLAARITIVISVIGIASRVLFVIVLDQGIAGALIAELVTAIVGAAIALVRHHKDLRGSFRLELLPAALRYGLPLVPHHMGGLVADNATRWILASAGDLTTVGHIGMASRLASPITAAVSAFTTAFTPMYFEWRAELSPENALKEARKASGAASALASTVALAMTLGGVVFLRWFLPESYHPAADLVGLVTATFLLRVNYALLSAEVFHMRRTLAMTLVFSSGSIVIVLTTLPFVRLFGPAGAVLAQFSGMLVSVLIVWKLATKTFPPILGARSIALVVGTILVVASASSIMPGTSMITDLLVGTCIGVPWMIVILLVSGVRPQHLKDLRKGKKKKKKGPDDVPPEEP